LSVNGGLDKKKQNIVLCH